MTTEYRSASPGLTASARRVWAWSARYRWWVLAGWTAVWTAGSMARPHGFGWHYFVTGAQELTSPRGLHLFADHPELQTGPVSVAAVVPLVRAMPAGVALDVATVVMAAAGLLALALVDRLIRCSPGRSASAAAAATRHETDPSTQRPAMLDTRPHRPVAGWTTNHLLLLGLLAVPVWAQLAVVWSHPDDVIAVVCAVAALVQLRRDRPVAAAVLLGLAVDAKPWALVFIPLLLMIRTPRRGILAAAVAAAVIAVAWLPFVLAAPGTLTAADFTIPVSPQSVLHLVGVRGRTPSWCRTVQLLLGLAVTAAAVLRHRWQYALLAGVAARMLLDPAAKPYYAAAAVFAAAVVDLTTHRLTARPDTGAGHTSAGQISVGHTFASVRGSDWARVVPWWTIAVFVGLFAVPTVLGNTGIGATAAGIARALVLLAALIGSVVGPRAADANLAGVVAPNGSPGVGDRTLIVDSPADGRSALSAALDPSQPKGPAQPRTPPRAPAGFTRRRW